MKNQTNQEIETFGSYLQGFRMKRELSIETVAAQTKIAAHCLRAIEANNPEQLPPPAYVKSFIRTYADIVGANADLAVNLYLADLTQQATIRRQKLRHRAKLGTVKRASLAAAVIVGILLLLRYTDIGMGPMPSQRSASAERPHQQSFPAIGTQDDGSSLVREQPEKLDLKVIAVAHTWLKVIVDGHNAKSYDLQPEDRLELEGSHDFNLMIGDAAGLKIFLNDRPVQIFGGSGQVVSLKIP